MACIVSDAERKVTSFSRNGFSLPAETLVGVTSHRTPKPLPVSLTPGSKHPKPLGKLLVPPLADGWQRKCQTLSNDTPASERAPPFVAQRTWRDDEAATARKQAHLSFRKSCRLLDNEGMSLWQQREYSVKGSLSARTWGEYQEAASRQVKLHHTVDGTRGFQEQLRQGDSKMVSASESMTILSPVSSADSVSSFASTSLDGIQELHDRFTGGDCRSNRVEREGCACKVSFDKNVEAPQHFDMSADDWVDVDEDFFPEKCSVFDHCN